EGTTYEVHDADKFNFDFGKTNQDELAKVVYHGYQNYVQEGTGQLGRFEAATQALIWKLMGAKIDYFNAFDTAYMMSGNMPWNNWADYVLAKVENHDKKPSFSGDTVTIKAGETITLTDSNDVLSSYKAGENFETGGLIIDRANNRLTLTATNSSDDNVKLEYQ